jgi:plastocyanin
MQKHARILIAFAIFLSGMALVPFAVFPSTQITWQQFADAYQPSEKQVSIEDFAFKPDTLIVTPGTTVRWTNNDSVAHTVTSDPAGTFDSGTLQPGESFEVLFDTPGIYPYLCTLHPFMHGTVIVSEQVFSIYLPVVTR